MLGTLTKSDIVWGRKDQQSDKEQSESADHHVRSFLILLFLLETLQLLWVNIHLK